MRGMGIGIFHIRPSVISVYKQSTTPWAVVSDLRFLLQQARYSSTGSGFSVSFDGTLSLGGGFHSQFAYGSGFPTAVADDVRGSGPGLRISHARCR